MPLGSLVVAGAVVGAPGADNLKIRPEFFPGILDNAGLLLVIGLI